MTREPPGVLAFHDVWKRFRRGERADSLRDLLARAARRLGRRSDPEEHDESFWALEAVSFRAEPGKILGIIGPNGAGKSTVLKLGTGIMQPTRGRVETRGRVGALIEIAAGFHPDLTGRENLYLQGAVMGMRRAEIDGRFDEIVDFAELWDFIDTPVKRYSSGMNARLGFAIAAHMDPDVLLIDEVLSVGDLAFQQKALARLETILEREIPIVVVSHQLDRVLALCDEAMLLVGGCVARRGSPEEVITAYLQGEDPAESGSDVGDIEVIPGSLKPGGITRSGSTLHFRVRGETRRPELELGVAVRTVPDGTALFAAYSKACGVDLPDNGSFDVEVTMDVNLGSGAFAIQPYLLDTKKRTPLRRGRLVLFEVRREQRAFGHVDLNARMRSFRP